MTKNGKNEQKIYRKLVTFVTNICEENEEGPAPKTHQKQGQKP